MLPLELFWEPAFVYKHLLHIYYGNINWALLREILGQKLRGISCLPAWNQ